MGKKYKCGNKIIEVFLYENDEASMIVYQYGRAIDSYSSTTQNVFEYMASYYR